MPFTQNTYWGSVAGEAANILWELVWDQHGFIFGIAYLAWKILQQYRGGGMSAVMTHVKDLWWSLRGVALPICRALLVVFLLLMFVWVPYQRARDAETSHAEQITKLELEKGKLGLEKDAKIHRLNAENVGLTKQLTAKGNTYQIDKAQIEQIAKERREKVIAKSCFNEPLRFAQKRVPSSEKASFMLYSKQVDIWLKKGAEMFKVYTDTQIIGIAKPEGLVDLTTVERSFVEYKLKSSAPLKNPLTLTIFNREPFEVLCVDQVPNRFLQ